MVFPLLGGEVPHAKAAKVAKKKASFSFCKSFAADLFPTRCWRAQPSPPAPVVTGKLSRRI
jgi:hypothetical protein